MYEIIKDDKFIKRAKKFFKNHPQLKDKFELTIYKLIENPYNPSLETHGLNGKLQGLSSCSINYEYRIILHIKIINKKIYLIDVGTHEIYKKYCKKK